MIAAPNRSEPLRILLPTKLSPEETGWHLGIKSLCETLSACAIPIDIKVFHINSDPRGATVADIVLFTFSNPLDYRVFFDFCRAAGLPSRAAQRGDHDPIFIGGGIGLANPEPLGEYLDLVIVGLDHEPIRQLVQIFPTGPLSRRSIIAKLMKTPNVYVPSAIEVAFSEFGEMVRLDPQYEFVVDRRLRRVTRAIGAQVSAQEGVLMPDLGCRHRCSFCVIPFLYPYQEASLAELSAHIDALSSVGVVNVKINSATATQYSDIGGLLAHLRSRGMGIALGSVRVDQITPEFIRDLASSHRISISQHLYTSPPPNGAASLTFGVETGSTRLLQLLNKKLTGREIASQLAVIIDAGLQNVGVYLLAGIPTETHTDVIDTATLIADISRRLKRVAGHVYVGANSIIPTPHTPMQRMPIMSCPQFSAWCDSLSDAVAAIVNDRETFGRIHFQRMPPATLVLETLAMRGDRRVGGVLEALHAADLWDDLDETTVANELARQGLPSLAFHRRRIAPEAILPWALVLMPSSNQEEQAYYERERVARGHSCIRQC